MPWVTLLPMSQLVVILLNYNIKSNSRGQYLMVILVSYGGGLSIFIASAIKFSFNV